MRKIEIIEIDEKDERVGKFGDDFYEDIKEEYGFWKDDLKVRAIICIDDYVSFIVYERMEEDFVVYDMEYDCIHTTEEELDIMVLKMLESLDGVERVR